MSGLPGPAYPSPVPDRSFKLLLETTRQMLSATDTSAVLAEAVQYAVPHLGDCCVIRLYDSGGRLTLARCAHVRLSAEQLERRLTESSLVENPAECVLDVLQTGRPALYTHVPTDLMSQPSATEEHLHLIRELEATATVIVPLIGQQGVLGVLTLTSGTPGRVLGSEELELATELGRSITLGLENVARIEASQHRAGGADEMLGMVVHDLKNPLGSILMSTSLLLRVLSQEESNLRTRTHLQLIQRSGERMNRMIQSLLDMAAMETGRFELELGPCLVTDLLQEALELQEQSAFKKRLRIELEPVRGGLRVQCDRARMVRALSDVLENAMRMAEEEAVIQIRVETVGVGAGVGTEGGAEAGAEAGTGVGAEVGAGAEVRVAMMEQRPEHGFTSPEGLGEHLFDRQWWAGRSNRRGAGIALPVARGIVEAHHGRIWIERDRAEERGVYLALPGPL